MMRATMSQAVAEAAAARCARHPENAAVSACTRCGTFVCNLDKRWVNGALYCETCAELPEVDYLETFRLKYWGKRDGWAWLIGLGALANVPLAISGFMGGNVVLGALLAFTAVVNLCFWLGMPWARYGLVAAQVLNIVVVMFSGVPAAGAGAVFPMLITLVIINDTRNKLFFKLEVPKEKLQKAWHLYANNSAARAGFLCGLIGLLFPPLAVVGVICSVIGLRQVDPNARPPIGRKGQAIAGIVLGGIGTLWGTAFAVSLLLL
jgi:hypothetical protein